MARIVKKLSEGTEFLLVAANVSPTTFTIGEWSTRNASVTINGNLTVLGTQTTINSNNTSITDNIVTLNSGTTGIPLDPGFAGFEVERGALPNALLVWDESIDRWRLSNDGGATYANIATISGSSYLSDVVEDLTPQLGGNLDINGFTITSTSGTNVVVNPDLNLQINKPLQLKQVTPPSAAINGYALLFANTVVGGGSTGVYVTHKSETTQELISKKKALIYSLILG